jgi:hypothetical protein
MNARLQELLRNYFNNPCPETMSAVARFHAPELDFSEELLNTFTPDQRLAIVAPLMFCSCWHEPSERFLRRRIVGENDALYRKILEATLARRVDARLHGKRDEEAVDYKQRSPEFQDRLRDLLIQHVNNPQDRNASEGIQELEPTDQDFTDSVFDSLTPQGRLEIYSMLFLWCGYTCLNRILKRRVKVETDPACKVSISVMLRYHSE